MRLKELKETRILILAVMLASFGGFMNEAKAIDYKAGMNRVEFKSEGEKMVGNLFLPADYDGKSKLQAIVVVGSLTSVKEQMPNLYGKKLAEKGFAVLTFDYRFFGESGGEPRFYVSPEKHIADISNAVAYLKTLPIIDAEKIGGLGICTSSGYMAVAASRDKNIKSLAAVALFIPSKDFLLQRFGGEEGIAERKQAGRAAREKYEQSGLIDYLLAYSPTPGNKYAANSPTKEYYFDKSRGQVPTWTNKFALMSWEELLDYDPMPAAEKITAPTLFVHSDNAASPASAREFYNRIKAPKDLIWTKDGHFDFYDKEPVVSNTANSLAEHFQKTLKGQSD
jgi:uncharacterized protein